MKDTRAITTTPVAASTETAPGTVAELGDRATSGHIVVGVDGSPASRAAVDFAIGEAERRHVALDLFHAFDIPVYATDPLGAAYVPIDRDELVAAAEAIVQEEAARVVRIAPDIAVRTVVQQGSASSMLIDASKDAAMVVVGAKHRSELADLVLGSVCHRVVHHATCPVVLVPLPTDH
jgi:nucleotide-binding universal stress UspA family protein